MPYYTAITSRKKMYTPLYSWWVTKEDVYVLL